MLRHASSLATAAALTAIRTLCLSLSGCAEPERDDDVESQDGEWTIRPSGPSNETAILLSGPAELNLGRYQLAPRMPVRSWEVDSSHRVTLAGQIHSNGWPYPLDFPLGWVPVTPGKETVGRLGAIRIVGGGGATPRPERRGAYGWPEDYDRSSPTSTGIVLEPTPFSIRITRSGEELGCFRTTKPNSTLPKECLTLLGGTTFTSFSVGTLFPALGRYEVAIATRDRTGAQVTTTKSLYVRPGATLDVQIPGASLGWLKVDAEQASPEIGTWNTRDLHIACPQAAPFDRALVRPDTLVGADAKSKSLSIWANEGQSYACQWQLDGVGTPFTYVGGSEVTVVSLRKIEVVDPIVGGAPRRGSFEVFEQRAGVWVKLKPGGRGTPMRTGSGLSVVPGKYRVVVSYVDDLGERVTLPPYESDV